jgi:hypothetical protein
MFCWALCCAGLQHRVPCREALPVSSRTGVGLPRKARLSWTKATTISPFPWITRRDSKIYQLYEGEPGNDARLCCPREGASGAFGTSAWLALRCSSCFKSSRLTLSLYCRYYPDPEPHHFACRRARLRIGGFDSPSAGRSPPRHGS